MNKTLYIPINSCYNENVTSGLNNRAFSKGFVLSPVRDRKGSKAESFRECLSYLRWIMGKKKNDNCGVYGIFNVHSEGKNKVYIGKSEDIERRWKDHKRLLNANKHGLNKSGQTDHLQRAWNNYGSESFEFHILKLCKSEELNHWEKILTWDHQSFNPFCGYNRTPGGETNTMTTEAKEKLRQRMKGNKNMLGKTHTAEVRKILSEVNKGNKNMLGKHHTKESNEKNRKWHLGRKCPESGIKISIANKGKKKPIRTEEHRKKLGQANIKYTHLEKEWKELKKQGLFYRKISKIYNIPHQTIINYLKKSEV
ncbi:MAG TPA: GIY-YIG nuclease family protein [Atribacterota bacterium]|nr:GIY-YIG nuclease family protein [Atribacterota bacterium]